MIDRNKRLEKLRAKEKQRKRIHVDIDPDNYEYIPEQKQTDYYDNDVPQRVAIYVRVSTDDVRQTTSFELQKKYYEDFHRVQVSDAIARKSVLLAQRYINDRFLPDKAIDLLDEACSDVNLRNPQIGKIAALEKDRDDIDLELQLLTETEDSEAVTEIDVLSKKIITLKIN